MNETEKRDRRDEKEEIRYHVIFYGQVQGVLCCLPARADRLGEKLLG